MQNIVSSLLVILNKVYTTDATLYFIMLGIILLLYLFFVSTSFFRLICGFMFTVNIAVLLSYVGMDFFSAFLLAAELPLLLIAIIFFFHKNSLWFDSLYSYQRKSTLSPKIFIVAAFLCAYIVVTACAPSYDFNFFYNFVMGGNLSIYNKNDFLLLFISYYNVCSSYILVLAVLIFVVSLIAILIFQTVKTLDYKKTADHKTYLILKKQNLLKQGVFTSALGFFNKFY